MPRCAAARGDGDDDLSRVDQHTADAGSELFENERDQSMITRLEQELVAIERAEQRLEEGTYGTSVESGEPIPDGRLEAVPVGRPHRRGAGPARSRLLGEPPFNGPSRPGARVLPHKIDSSSQPC